jgi:CTP:molybdopterin cytidylyltransferase MocA
MASRTDSALHEFYVGLANNHAVALDEHWQHRLVEHSTRTKRWALYAAVLRRPDVSDDIVDAASRHTAALVKAAWITQHCTSLEEKIAAVDGETRKGVLISVVDQPDLPDAVFDRIVDRADSAELVAAILASGRVDSDTARTLVRRVADQKSVRTNKVKYAFEHAAANVCPGIFDELLAHTTTLTVAKVTIDRCQELDHPAQVAHHARVLEPYLSADQLDDDQSTACVDMLEALGRSEIDPDLLGPLLQRGRTALAASNPTLYAPESWQLNRLKRLTEIESDQWDQIAGELIAGDDESARHVLRRVVATKAAQTRPVWLAERGYTRLLGAIVAGDYHNDVRAEALEMGLQDNYSVLRPAILGMLRRGLAIDTLMAVTVARRVTHQGLDVILSATDDPDAAMDAIIEQATSAGVLLQAASLGLLDDRRKRVAARQVPKDWFSELPANDPAIVEVVQLALDGASHSLAGHEEAWQFFEACYGTVSTNPAELADYAAGGASR